MNFCLKRLLPVLGLAACLRAALPPVPAPRPVRPGEQCLLASGPLGRYGGNLVASLHSPPRTLNPAVALDLASQQIVGLLNGDLLHINRYTQRVQPALAESWRVLEQGRRYILTLRRGLRFSNGEPFTARDVVFSFHVYLDPRTHSPQRDLLTVGGQPIRVRELGKYQVEFDLAQSDAAAERLFDGVAILPRRLLESIYRQGRIRQAWSLSTPPAQIAGLGPFRLRRYVPGQKLVLERNPYYWKVDAAHRRLPYLNRLTFLIVPTENAEILRFDSGEVDVISGFSAQDASVLAGQQAARGFRLYDLGPGLEYDFLFFNQNHLPPGRLAGIAYKQVWFRQTRFRQAISAAVDRQAIVRLVFQGRAAPLWDQVSPGEKFWTDRALPRPARSLSRALALLHSAGFRTAANGRLLDAHGRPVNFTLLANASNAQQMAMATIVQNNLRQLGMGVRILPLDFQAFMTRIFQSYDYEACLLGLVSGDADPNPEMNIWISGGSTHLWNLTATRSSTPWQARLNRLMRRQMTERNPRRRKQLYDQVQRIVARYDPVVCLASPDVLVAARNDIGGLRPAVLRDYALWNADQLYFRHSAAGAGR